MKRAVVAGVVAAAMVLGTVGSARAQSVSAEVRQQAERRMARGVELRGAGRDEDALVELRASYELNPEPRAAAQLGLVNQALGNWLEADRLLREALAAGGDGWVRRNRAALEQAAGVVDQRVGLLIVRGNVPGAEVRVEGRAVGRLPMSEPVRVLAGEVSVEVRAAGYATRARRLTVRGGETLRESFELRAGEEGGGLGGAGAMARVPEGRRDESRGLRRAIGIGGLVGGGALLIGGVSANIAGANLARDYRASMADNRCRGEGEPSPRAECTAVLDQLKTAEGLMIAGYIAGGVVGVTGLALLLSSISRQVSGATVSTGCLLDLTRAGITCEVRF